VSDPCAPPSSFEDDVVIDCVCCPLSRLNDAGEAPEAVLDLRLIGPAREDDVGRSLNELVILLDVSSLSGDKPSATLK
jgi:hypothetical protein